MDTLRNLRVNRSRLDTRRELVVVDEKNGTLSVAVDRKLLFSWYFSGLLRDRGIIPAEFARLVNCSLTLPASIQGGHAKSPAKLEVLEAWAKALNLSTEERWRFIGLAGLDHSPEWFVEWYWQSKRHL